MRENELQARAVRVGACLIWQGAIKSNGYGNVIVGGQTWSVHRLSYALSNGPIPDGLRVLHSCDVRACIEPTHLHLGTARENSREMVERGRHRGTAKLSVEQRAEISAAAAIGEPYRAIAVRFGVSPSTISNFIRGRYYARPAETAA